jgi:NADPH-dependent 2,4-dienoyl-CoA reductase/sulfur reductase-like enzyme
VKFTDIPTLRAPGISFAQGIVASVDLERKIAKVTDVNSGDDFEESYDFLVACSGMRRSWPVVPQSLTKAKYLTEVGAHIDLMKNAREGVVVIGGGEHVFKFR